MEVLAAHGFEQIRQKGSHRTLKGTVHGKVHLVQIAYHRISDDVLPKTLASIIRQSGLDKSLFR